jgi:hypothetical protein
MDVSSAWLLGWRWLYALTFAFVPWALPPDLPTPSTLDGVLLRAVVGWAALVAVAGRLVRVLRASGFRSPLALVVLACLLAALVAAIALPTATVPLGASCYFLGPLVWLALAYLVARRAPVTRRRSVIALVATAAVVTYATSRCRAFVRSMRSGKPPCRPCPPTVPPGGPSSLGHPTRLLRVRASTDVCSLRQGPGSARSYERRRL